MEVMTRRVFDLVPVELTESSRVSQQDNHIPPVVQMTVQNSLTTSHLFLTRYGHQKRLIANFSVPLNGSLADYYGMVESYVITVL